MTESYIINKNFKIFSINTFKNSILEINSIMISWYANYHILPMAITTRELKFIPLDENKSCIYR